MIDVAILVLRVFMGLVMIPHGAHKLQELGTLNKKWREKYGLPTGSVALAGFLEVVCGFAMIVGVFSSVAAFILAVVMLVGTYVSIWKDHEPYLSLPRGKGWDFNVFLFGTLIAQIFLGDGLISLLHLFS
ncbi:MAG: DoxX family protein [Chloroflexi bacterium]|nr:DoxX family protein [Chloroflexota bacterium]